MANVCSFCNERHPGLIKTIGIITEHSPKGKGVKVSLCPKCYSKTLEEAKKEGWGIIK